MKRSCLIIALLLSIASAGWANMLTNPGFESGFTGWSSSNAVEANTWAYRTGSGGVSFQGWVSGFADNRFFQDVTATNGTYTFTIWARREANNGMYALQLRLDWLNSSGVILQTTTNSYNSLPNNRIWHQLAASGTCADSSVAKVRATVFSQWTVGGSDPRALMLDDANLYAGAYAGSGVYNGSFELNGNGDWDHSGWNGSLVGWNNGGYLADPGQLWAARTGTNGISIVSWDNYSTNYSTTFYQYVYPSSTGTHFFGIYIKRELNTLFSNAVMTIDWYDSNFAVVQSTTSSNLVVPNDGQWHEQFVEGVCTSPAIYEARCSVACDWSYNVITQQQASAMIDDARFLKGAHANPLITDWAYHNSSGYKASQEMVPQTNVGSFLQISYAKTNVTFYVLANNPDQAAYYPDETAVWQVLTEWPDPGNGGVFTNQWGTMTKVGSVDVTNTAAFHGLPASGSKKLDVWKYEWALPKNPGGIPYTNQLRVYYSPFVKSLDGSLAETDFKYLLMITTNDVVTNNVGQLFGKNPYNVNYNFEINPPVYTSLYNAGFETPATNDMTAESGWSWWGNVGKDAWAGRSGSYGGSFRSWDPGAAGIYQNVSATGGTYTAALWLQEEIGVDPTSIELKLEWYDSAGTLVQTDSKDLTGFPRDGSWHHIYVTGTCTSNSIYLVRPVFAANFNDNTNDPCSMMFDDVALYQGVYTGVQVLANTSFEDRSWEAGWRGGSWYTIPNKDSGAKGADRKNWWRSGSWGFGLLCYTNEGANPGDYYTTLSQNLYCGTGTYTFSIWMLKEVNTVLTNAKLKIEWYDSTYKTKVQPDTVTDITASVTADWARFDITGSCDSNNLFEVRPSLELGWQVTALDIGGKGVKIDDARFVRGAYPRDLVDLDYAYYNAQGFNPTTEQVPGTNVGAFLQVNYARTTTTFYVLVNNPDAAVMPDESSSPRFRLYYVDPYFGSTTVWADMTKMGSVNISSGSPFHGLPSAGTKTLDLYKYDWQQPTNPITGGVTTNAFSVYYCPFIESKYGISLTDTKYLAAINGEYTNNYTSSPQLATRDYINKDWVYTNQWATGDTNYTDGIPNWWWDKYSVPGGSRAWGGDYDNDAFNNLEEYAGDTDPSSTNSYFPRVTNTPGSRAVMYLVVNPSSTGRVYDAYWKTNLMNNSTEWQNYNLSVTGNGASITLTVTNDDVGGKRFFRTGAKLP